MKLPINAGLPKAARLLAVCISVPAMALSTLAYGQDAQPGNTANLYSQAETLIGQGRVSQALSRYLAAANAGNKSAARRGYEVAYQAGNVKAQSDLYRTAAQAGEPLELHGNGRLLGGNSLSAAR